MVAVTSLSLQTAALLGFRSATVLETRRTLVARRVRRRMQAGSKSQRFADSLPVRALCAFLPSPPPASPARWPGTAHFQSLIGLQMVSLSSLRVELFPAPACAPPARPLFLQQRTGSSDGTILRERSDADGRGRYYYTSSITAYFPHSGRPLLQAA